MKWHDTDYYNASNTRSYPWGQMIYHVHFHLIAALMVNTCSAVKPITTPWDFSLEIAQDGFIYHGYNRPALAQLSPSEQAADLQSESCNANEPIKRSCVGNLPPDISGGSTEPHCLLFHSLIPVLTPNYLILQEIFCFGFFFYRPTQTK